MPTLPMLLDSPISGGDLPVTDAESIARLEPYFVSEQATAAVRDAVRAALVAMFTLYQAELSDAAGQGDVLRATGIYLAGLGTDRKVFQQSGEPQEAYRARIIQQGGVVTPNIIMIAVNAILAPYTGIKAAYLESILDRAFISNGTSPYRAYVRDGVTLGGVDPSYPDRLYDDDIAANGVSIPNRHPAGFWSFGDFVGRYFVLRIPDLSAINNEIANVYNGTSSNGVPTETLGNGFFVYNATITSYRTYVNEKTSLALDLYQAVVNTVNALIGHSIRWRLSVDPLMS